MLSSLIPYAGSIISNVQENKSNYEYASRKVLINSISRYLKSNDVNPDQNNFILNLSKYIVNPTTINSDIISKKTSNYDLLNSYINQNWQVKSSISTSATFDASNSSKAEISIQNVNILSELQINELKLLATMIESEEFEVGYVSNSQRFFDSLYRKNRDSSLKVLNKLFLNSFNKEKIVIGILHILSNYTYDEVDPNGGTIALASCSHKSELVKESLLFVFDKWSNSEALRLLLDNVRFESAWLENYRINLIKDLQELLYETSS